MKKRMLCAVMAAVMLLSLVPTAFAASDKALAAANALYELELFKGVGTNSDGTPDFDLDRAPTRNEALTMLVRLLGKENEALFGAWNIPFTDVADWAKPYVGYAYTNGLTIGTSATTFGGDDTVTASQYITFILRALGYESDTDFQWDQAWELSDGLGLTKGEYGADTLNFNRGDVAILSNRALDMTCKDMLTLLRDSIEEGMSGTQNDAAWLEGLWQATNADGKIAQEIIFENGRWKLAVGNAYHEGSYTDNEDAIALTREYLVDTATNEVRTDDFSPQLNLVRNADGSLSYDDGLWTNVVFRKGGDADELPQLIEKAATLIAEFEATGSTTMDASTYAYLAVNDFRNIRDEFPTATAQCAYVYLYENLDGEQCVLVDIRYKIISNFRKLILHNLDQNTVITDPVDYYKTLANRSYGGTKIYYMKLYNEIYGLHMQMLQAMKTVLEGGQNPWSGVFVDANTLNK